MRNHIILLFSLIFSFSLNVFGGKIDCPANASVQANCSKKEIEMAKELSLNQTTLNSLKTQLSTISSSLGTAHGACVDAVTPHCKPNLAKATAAISAAQTSLVDLEITQTKCIETHSKGDFLCSLTTSPQAQMGMILMNQLSASLGSTNSAKETCDSTNKAAFSAQTLLSAGGAYCAVEKTACMTSCGASTKTLGKIIAQLEEAQGLVVSSGSLATSTLTPSISSATGTASNKSAATSELAAKCSGAFATGLTQIAKTGADLMKSSLEAKACSEKLAGTSGAGQSIDQMCAIPANAETSMCKCRTNNTAQGCPGYLAAVEGNLKAIGTGGASNMAGVSFGKVNPSGGGNNIDLGDIGEEAQQILANTGEDSKSSGLFGSSGGASLGAGGSTAAGTGAAGGDAKGEESKPSMGSNFGTVGSSAYRGSFGNGRGAAGGTGDKFTADKYLQLKRQLASDQLRSEISGASGRGNFEKIKDRYQNNARTFVEGGG